MTATHRILCPTDLTSNSQDSVAYALRLAKENSAELIVIHAISFPTLSQLPCELEAYYYQWEQCLARFKVDQLIVDAERRVRNFVGTRFGAESDSVVWKPRAALGEVAEEIVRAAFQEEVDLIVMDRCKRSGLARLFRPSIPEAVGRRAPCPVLSIDTTQFVSSSRARRLPLLRGLFQSP
jgi:nucleotide-binding universal stress UspA family protein